MLDLLALLTNNWSWKLYSWLITAILRGKGLRVGKNFYIEGTPKLKIRGRPQDIVIGDNVKVLGAIDLRNRELGKIVIEDDVVIDNNCRFVAANNAVLRIGSRTGIGAYCIFNCGTDVTIGPDCLFAGMVMVQSSEHGLARDQTIKDQPHTYAAIVVGADCWIASGAMLAKGTHLGRGCVVGAKSFVRNARCPDYSILVGTPARMIKERV